MIYFYNILIDFNQAFNTKIIIFFIHGSNLQVPLFFELIWRKISETERSITKK